MWYIVVIQVWKHWDSKYSTIKAVPVYAVDNLQALKLVEAEALENWGAVSSHQVLECGRTKPKVVWSD